MKKTKFQRLTALLLCLIFAISCFTVMPMAAGNADSESDGSVNGSATDSLYDPDEVIELLNAISYSEYVAENAAVERGKDTIVVDAIEDLYADMTDADCSEEIYDGIKALLTPSTGTVSWKVTVPKRAKYTISVVYYAYVPEGEETKADAVERVFKINKKVPFSEARYITIKKNWVNDYPDALYIGKKDINTVLNAGKNAGLNGYIEDGKLYFVYPEVWTAASSSFCDEYGVRFMKLDINNNEIRPAAFQKAKWDTYNMTDSMGYFTEPFEFVLEEGENVISLEGKNARLAISHIILAPAEDVMTYEQYKAKYAGKPRGEGSIKLEAEYTHSASDKTIYPIEDSANAMTSPHDPSRVLLNTVGGEKWQTAGQSVSYKFSVDKSGMYDIVSRFNQSVLDGMFVNRSLYIYSEGLEEGADGYYNGIPFSEAKTLTYNYGDGWQVTEATDGNTEGGFEFYFEAGVVYTIKFEVTLGAMSEIINDVQSALDHINSDYLSIIQLTGSTPDTYRDYGFSRIMPDVLIDMVSQAYVLNNEDPDPAKWGVAQKLTALAGQKSSNVATLQKVADLLLEMGRDEDEIARLLERLKSYIGTLGTFLSSAKTQPLQLDYIMIQGTGEEKPEAQANFWDTFIHEIKRFYYSFTRDYNNVGKLVETDEDSLQVWLATGRDQSQVKRNLINNDFTPNTGIAVDLKLVAGGTLLPSILANKGPDVYLGLGQGDVINYAIRSAILPIEEFPDFKEVTKSFNESAMTVLSMADPDGVTHYYGLPESQGFAMMFVRVDILADLGIDIPQTWDDIMAAIPKLQAKNMQMGLTTDSQIHLYQMGGELFADDGMRINLDSQVGLAAFKKTCELFTKYSFPYSYDAANRFRTGEMPILIGDYTGLYNQLKVFATEIEGAWVMVPVPGVRQEDGSINNKAISSVSASVLVKGCEDQKNNAWEYIKWFTGDYCQTEYANEMVALLGPSAKYPTANINALERLPWTVEELARIKAQFNNLATVPNYPGAYIVGRYTEFAFLAAYNDGEDPAQAILGYIYNINKEITRKRTEFGLETLEQGETLASKRIGQAKAAAQELKSRSSAYSAIYDKVEFACRSKDTAVLYSLAEEIMTQTSVDTKVVISRGPDITKLSEKQLMYYIAVALEHAADALLTY